MAKTKGTSSMNASEMAQRAWLEKARSYCAYQERCRQEVAEKLRNLGATDVEPLLQTLEQENFLNEERFANSFAGGKFRTRQWGKYRIKLELQKRQIPEHLIEKALQTLSDKTYKDALRAVIEKKDRSLKDRNLFSRRRRLVAFAQGKGYEVDLVWELVREIYPP